VGSVAGNLLHTPTEPVFVLNASFRQRCACIYSEISEKQVAPLAYVRNLRHTPEELLFWSIKVCV